MLAPRPLDHQRHLLAFPFPLGLRRTGRNGVWSASYVNSWCQLTNAEQAYYRRNPSGNQRTGVQSGSVSISCLLTRATCSSPDSATPESNIPENFCRQHGQHHRGMELGPHHACAFRPRLVRLLRLRTAWITMSAYAGYELRPSRPSLGTFSFDRWDVEFYRNLNAQCATWMAYRRGRQHGYQ